jgi:hypothetical protein
MNKYNHSFSLSEIVKVEPSFSGLELLLAIFLKAISLASFKVF